MEKQMYISYAAICCAEDDIIAQLEKLGLEAEYDEDVDRLIVRGVQVDIDADILRKLDKYGIEELAIDAGDEAEEIYNGLVEIGCDLTDKYIETDEHYIGIAGWTRQVSFEAFTAIIDIEKIIEVLF